MVRAVHVSTATHTSETVDDAIVIRRSISALMQFSTISIAMANLCKPRPRGDTERRAAVLRLKGLRISERRRMTAQKCKLPA